MLRQTPSLDAPEASRYRLGAMSWPRPGNKNWQVRYLSAPSPLHFPVEAEAPGSIPHLVLRTFLFRLLRFALGPDHSVGSDQFVYWVGDDPRRCLAPDAFVKLGVPQTRFKSWMSWKHGAPDLAVEIAIDNESLTWAEKLERYASLGVDELVRFDAEAPEPARLRVWDRIDERLVERTVRGGEPIPCRTLGLEWVIAPVENEPCGIRLADQAGTLLLVPEEHEAAKRREAETQSARDRAEALAERERAAAEHEHAMAEKARADAAEARLRELEAKLRDKGV